MIGARRLARIIRLEFEPASLRLGDHPDEGDVGQRIVGIAAADIGMHAGEPDLADTLVLDEALCCGIGQRRSAIGAGGLVPELRVEGGAFLVERQRLAGARDARGQMFARQFKPPEIFMNAAGHFVDRHAVGGNRVPNADEPDLDVPANLPGRVVRTELVAEPLVGRFQPQIVIAIPAIGAVGRTREAMQFGFVIGFDQPLAVDQPHHDPDREGTAAEAEAEQFVVLVAIVPAGKLVERDDVAAQAETERTAEDRHRLERRGADAVVIERDLVVA